MIVLHSSVVHRGDHPALFPGLTRAANGDLLVSFCTRFDCLPGGEAFQLRSSDEGRTWSPARLMVRSKKADGCINLSVGLTTLNDGTLLYPCCDARLTRKWDQHEADLLILRSLDHGHRWTPPQPIPIEVTEPFAYGRIVELTNGDLLCPIWGKRVPDEPWRSGLVRSRDGGLTWAEHSTIAYDPQVRIGQTDDGAHHCGGFNETSILERSDGTLLAVLRQQGVGRHQRELYCATSDDRGRTWSKAGPTGLWGTSPSLHQTPSGDMLLGYRNHLGNPQGLTRPGVGISLSHDQGRSWRTHLLLEDPKGHQYGHEFEAGYPAFLSLDDRLTLVVFYSSDPTLPCEHYVAANVLAGPTPTDSNA